jgi:hypothetical protein
LSKGSILLNFSKAKPIIACNASRSRVEGVWRLLIDLSLSQRRRCLCPSSASPRSGCAQVQRHCSSFWGRILFFLGDPLKVLSLTTSP